MSLFELHCIAIGSAKAAGAEEMTPPPTDEEHDDFVAKIMKLRNGE